MRGFKIGILANLSNPKMITFFVGLYSVTVLASTAMWAKVSIIIGGFSIELIWYGLVALLMSSKAVRRVYDRFSLWIERIIGTALTLFGLRLIIEKF